MKARFVLLLAVLATSLSAQDFRVFDGPFNDLCFNPADQRLYVVKGGSEADGNAILALDPADGSVLQRIPVGSEPSVIRVSDNGRYLYVVLYGAPYLQRYDLTTGAFDPVLDLEGVVEVNGDTYHYAQFAGDVAALPGNGQSFVLVRKSLNTTPSFQGMAVVDNTTVRPTEIGPGVTAGNFVVLGADGQTVWGLGHDYEPTAFKRYQITAQGLSEVSNHPGLIVTEVTHVAHQNGRIYLQNGQIFDVTSGTPTLLTTLDIGQGYGFYRAPLTPSIDANELYEISDFDPTDPFFSNYQGQRLKVLDKTTFAPLNDYVIPGWKFANAKKVLSLGQGRVAVLGVLGDRPKLALFNPNPCQNQNLGLTVSPAGLVVGCFGDTVTLQAAPGYANYYWSNGVTGSTLRVSASGFLSDSFSYRVLAPNGCLSQSSPYTRVQFDQAPNALWYTLENYRSILCPGETAGIYPSSNTAWRFACSNGDTILPNQKFVVAQAGVYSIWALSQFGCVSKPELVEIFEAHPGETAPEVTASGPLSFCPNAPTVLSAPPGAFGYEWSNGATTRSITPPYSTQYAVRLKYADGCVSGWSDTLAVQVRYVPPVLSLRESYSTLFINALENIGDSVQWSLNGQVLPGVNDNSYLPQQNGFYTLQNFQDGCVSAPSPPFVYPQPVAVTLTGVPFNPDWTEYYLSATPTPNNEYTFEWNNWSANFGASVLVNEVGTYCVTVTRVSDGATATACLTLVPNDKVEVSSVFNAATVAGMPIVLFKRNGQTVTPLDTLVAGPDGKVLFENLAAQEHLLLAAPPVGSPLANQFLPTYFYSALLWSDANVFTPLGFRLSTDPALSLSIQLYPAQMLTGSGTVSGFLSDGPGFAGSPTSDGSGVTANGDPLAGVSVLLYDANGNVVGSTVTDASGYYSFGNLPPGTYTVWVNLPGVPPASQTVTLTSGSPTVGAVSFTLVNGVFEVVSATTDLTALNARLWPNPTSGLLWLETPVAVSLTLTNSLGQRLLQQKYPAGQHVLNALEGQPAGVYFVQLRAGSGQAARMQVVKMD